MAPSRGSVVRRKIKFLRKLLERGIEDEIDVLHQIQILEESLKVTTKNFKDEVISYHFDAKIQPRPTARHLDEPTDLNEYAERYPQTEVDRFGLKSYGVENLQLPGQLYLDIYTFTQSMPREVRDMSPPTTQFAALNIALKLCGGTLFGLDSLFHNHENLMVELEHIIQNGFPTIQTASEITGVFETETCTPIELFATPLSHRIMWADEIEAVSENAIATTVLSYTSETIIADESEKELPQHQAPVTEDITAFQRSSAKNSVFEKVTPSLVINMLKTLTSEPDCVSSTFGLYLKRYSTRYKLTKWNCAIRCKLKLSIDDKHLMVV